MKQFLVIDGKKCTGCRNCELACSVRNTGTFNPARSRIQILKDEINNRIMPVVCLQCDTALCAAACPTGAIVENSVGVLTVNDELCIGCTNCITACIYGGIAIDGATRKVIKCDLCGGEPACIAACEYNAIKLVDADVTGKRERMERLKPLMLEVGTIGRDA